MENNLKFETYIKDLQLNYFDQRPSEYVLSGKYVQTRALYCVRCGNITYSLDCTAGRSIGNADSHLAGAGSSLPSASFYL